MLIYLRIVFLNAVATPGLNQLNLVQVGFRLNLSICLDELVLRLQGMLILVILVYGSIWGSQLSQPVAAGVTASRVGITRPQNMPMQMAPCPRIRHHRRCLNQMGPTEKSWKNSSESSKGYDVCVCVVCLCLPEKTRLLSEAGPSDRLRGSMPSESQSAEMLPSGADGASAWKVLKRL